MMKSRIKKDFILFFLLPFLFFLLPAIHTMSNRNNNLHNNPHLELPPPPQQMPQPPPPQSRREEQIASVYPKLPSQDDLPSYSPYNLSSPSSPQPPQQFMPQPQPQLYIVQSPQSPPQQYNQVTGPCNHYQQPPPPPQQQQRPTYYGSMAAPNISSPAPIPPQQQNGNQPPLVIQPLTALKTKSDLVECPHCHQLVYTVLDYDAGLCTGISIAGLCLAGVQNGLCLLPFLLPWMKDVTHQCPSCKERIATFTRLERDTRIYAPPVGL